MGSQIRFPAADKQPVIGLGLIVYTIVKAGNPGATWTCTSTARASIPSKATVVTCWTIATPLSAGSRLT